jgi:serine protease Do
VNPLSVSAELGAIAAEALPNLVVVGGGRGSFGTGVVWDRSGLILTNDHVAHGEHPVLELSDGRSVRGHVVARDRRNDLAAISVDAEFSSAAQPSSSEPKLGQLVLALGHPLGLRDSISMGIVSGLSNCSWMGQFRRDLLQVDLQLAPGNSGGPLLDTQGHVVGIACMVASPGIALVVPARLVAEFVERIRGRKAA